MGLYDKYARLAGERLQFSDNGLTPFGTCIDEVYSATEGRIGNKKVILAGCIDSLEVRKKPGGHWIIRDLAGLDLVGLASL